MRSPIALWSLLSACQPGFLSLTPTTGDDSGGGQETGNTDDTAPPADAVPWRGTGADGAMGLAGPLTLDVDLRGDREQPDVVRYVVQVMDGASITLVESGLGLAAGDEALLLNQRGSEALHGSVGAWAFVTITAVDDAQVELEQPPEVFFGESSNEDLDGQIVVLQRVPQYTRVELEEGASLGSSSWDRAGGGVLALRASEGLWVRSGASIDLSSTGFEGGDTGSGSCDGFQGESYTGWGLGGTCGGDYNETYGYDAANAGGGGCNITGGGGGHGAYGQPGDAWRSGQQPPSGGETYGDEALSQLFVGSGGGGVWNGNDGTEGPGGNGGGIVLLTAAAITVEEGGAIRADGEDTTAWSAGSYTYGAGGGAGGSVWLVAEELSLAEGSVSAVGGEGEDDHERAGGAGGEGRVRVDCQTCNGAEQGSAGATEALSLACEPDPGWSGVPE